MPIKILLVEDEEIVSLVIEDMLVDLGHEVVGSAATLAQAAVAVEAGGFHLAILDINLGRDESFPIADRLREIGIPFVFSSGYGSTNLPARYIGNPVLSKPFKMDELARVIDLQS